MKKQPTKKPLVLSKDTIRQLSEQTLANIAAGQATTVTSGCRSANCTTMI